MEGSAEGRRLHLATGLTTAVTDDGDGKPPVLLLHPWAGSRRSFAALLPLVVPRARAIAVDLRGHGDADKPSAGYELPTLAADVVATLDALQLGQVVLVGASSGGYVAQQVAVAAPDRVAGLILAGAPRDLRGRPPFVTELETITDPVDPAWVRAFTAGFTDLDRLPSWYVDLMVDDALRLPASIWMATFHGLTSSVPPTDIGVIKAPTLVISGERDGLLGREQTADLVSAIPGAQWIEYPDTGHLVLEEQPVRLAADVVSFIDGLSEQDRT
ncbi:alpha/beta hydrolase [Blastococcus sp. CT_GayMR16]|uniref:alpha/beta fold hydrolase n=1 Tax=Blastococcus sp. CT_GayMR16 TaxID=2559607 RepID=UPI001073695E|nr:alpha/beta hydrolase [Blastococcus sp. CT_GayMR16]TFV85811.1 alpha/beta hydrolase [Blastococcus sp. CT_GayMR16]